MSLPPSGARPATAAAIDDPRAIRVADAEVLSLALIDARNELLRWLAAFETAGLASGGEAGVPAWRRVGRAAWYQEHWISRHVQCQRGEHCDAAGLRLRMRSSTSASTAATCGADSACAATPSRSSSGRPRRHSTSQAASSKALVVPKYEL